jgi:hypothetical protein
MRQRGWILAAAALLGACGKEPPPRAPTVDTGRPETRSIEAADAAGYNGKLIRQKVDNSLNANDDYNRQLQEQGNP